MRKGVIEIQFNWIFILIAGGVMLFFFLALIGNQKQSADKTIAKELIERLDTLIISTEQSYETYKEITLPRTTMTFTCSATDEGVLSELRVRDFTVPTESHIVFVPGKLTDDTFTLWTHIWEEPYRIMPFLYLSSPGVQIVVVNTTGASTEEFLSWFPNNMTPLVVQPSEVFTFSNDGIDYTVFVYFNESSALLTPNLPSLDGVVAAVVVHPVDGGIAGMGNISFFFQRSSGMYFVNESPYVGKAFVLGAAFSGDADAYACNLEKAWLRYEFVTAFQQQRVNLLLARLPVDVAPYCRLALLQANNTLTSIDSLRAAHQASSVIKRLNEDLMRGRGCPLIL